MILQMITTYIKENCEHLIHKAYSNLDFIIGGVSGATIGFTSSNIDWTGESVHIIIAIVRTVLCAIAGVLAVRAIHWIYPDKTKKQNTNEPIK